MKKLTYKHITALQHVEAMLETTTKHYADPTLVEHLEDDLARIQEVRQHLHKAISQPTFTYPPDGDPDKE